MRVSELADRFGLELRGPDREVDGIAALEVAGPEQLSFLANPKLADKLATTRAAAVIVDAAHAEAVETALVSDNPYLAMVRVAGAFVEPQGCLTGVSDLAYVHSEAQVHETATVYPFAFVAAGARLGAGVRVFPHCYVGEKVEIGADTILYPGVTLMAGVCVGSGCILHPGAVLGADGFGYVPGPQGLIRVPQLGGCEVGDNVDVGANTTVDRGSMGVTRLDNGVKLDNLVMIAHNVTVGPHSVLVGQVGVSGSTQVGSGVQMGGQAGLAGHLNIGDGARIGAKAGLMQDVPAGAQVIGIPAMEGGAFFRMVAHMRKLPETAKRIRKLERELEDLKRHIANGDEDDQS